MWLVQIAAGNVVNLCIAIDGDAKLIFDNEEEYSLRLSVASLKACCRDGAQHCIFWMQSRVWLREGMPKVHQQGNRSW